jgi:hypothetical protein
MKYDEFGGIIIEDSDERDEFGGIVIKDAPAPAAQPQEQKKKGFTPEQKEFIESRPQVDLNSIVSGLGGIAKGAGEVLNPVNTLKLAKGAVTNPIETAKGSAKGIGRFGYGLYEMGKEALVPKKLQDIAENKDLERKPLPSILQPRNEAQKVAGMYSEAASNIASMGIPLGPKINPVGKIGKATDKLTGRMAEGATGVSENALRTAGTKQGRAALENAAGKENEIGQRLADDIDNAHFVIAKNSKNVESALNNVKAVDVTGIADNLEALAGNPTTKELKAASEQIRGKAQELRELAANSPTGKDVHPMDLLEFRREVDQIIGDEFGKSSGKYLTALKSARSDMKNALITAAKGTEYEVGMKELATKLDAVDKMKQIMGKSVDVREGRAESFIKNITNMGKKQQREWLNNFEDAFNPSRWCPRAACLATRCRPCAGPTRAPFPRPPRPARRTRPGSTRT